MPSLEESWPGVRIIGCTCAEYQLMAGKCVFEAHFHYDCEAGSHIDKSKVFGVAIRCAQNELQSWRCRGPICASIFCAIFAVGIIPLG